MERTCLLVLIFLTLSCWRGCSALSNFTVPGESSRPPALQVDGEGRAFVAAGNQLMRLNSDLGIEQNVTLSSDAVNISLSSGGEWLVVCSADLSCAVHSANDLSTVSSTSGSALAAANRVALFTAGDSFYVGSHDPTPSISGGTLRLQQVYGLSGSGFTRFTDYVASIGNFQRDFFSGFLSGTNSYYVVSDHQPSSRRDVRIMRVCHVTSCPSGASTCGVTAVYEEIIPCGGTLSDSADDGVCGVSLVEDFAGTSGPSLVMARCRQDQSTSSNLICVVPISEVDSLMDERYDDCSSGTGTLNVAWIANSLPCSELTADFTGRCSFGTEIGVADSLSTEILDLSIVINIGLSGGTTISASVAVQLEGFSLVVVAYTIPSSGEHEIGIFQVTDVNTGLVLNNAFGVQPVSSLVRTLQWHSGLDYVLAATDTAVLKIPLEECSSSPNCSSCVTNSNPLCGWCVVENKCSRQTLCQNSNSTSSTRWLSTNTSSSQCIVSTVTPDQYLLDDQQLLSVSVSGPGLPVKLPDETYSCFFEDVMGRFNFSVPSVEITAGTSYTCNITDQVPSFDEVQVAVHFSFVSSLVGVPFDRTDNALTIFRCGTAESCTDCLETGSACGWCVVNKLCRGTSQDCINEDNFLQLSEDNTFEDVCPLLGNTNYTQHVRVATDLQLNTTNLPDVFNDSYSYNCLIGDVEVDAVRNDETSLTCQILQDDLTSSQVVGISIVWTGPSDLRHTIDSITDPTVTLYDCNGIAEECSSCVLSRDTPGFQCGWCMSASTCSIQDECSQSPTIFTTGGQCPDHIITSFSPSSGPPSGGTTITIMGTDLGVTFDDFDSPSGITVGGVTCTPLSDNYLSGERVLCETTSGLPLGEQALVVSLERDSGITPVPASERFTVVLPTLVSVDPAFGPIAGGTEVIIEGTGLDIGNSATVTVLGVDGTETACSNISRTASEINCTTSSVSSTSASGQVVVQIDDENITEPEMNFTYRNNPNFTSVSPQLIIPAGGILLTFTGDNLDVAQNPRLVLNGASSSCEVVNATLTCLVPPTNANSGQIQYSLVLDNAPFPDISDIELLQLSSSPNPSGFTLVVTPVSLEADSAIVRITAMNLDSVLSEEIKVTVGGVVCEVSVSTESDTDEIFCNLLSPSSVELDLDNTALVNVSVGTNINKVLDVRLPFVTAEEGDTLPITIIVPAVVAPVVVIFLCCLIWIAAIICYSRRAGKKKELQYTSLIAKMELLEYNMADECKRAFTELQTDLADLVQISSDKNLPYRDFRTFAMRFLFPKAGDDHPVLLPLQVTGLKLEEKEVMRHLDSFKELLMDKKFLLVFIRTMESQHSFSLQDKCDVASLLMVAFQNNLDYATDVLQTLLAETMRKSIAKSHPKLLLRRTESVAEKMLANWQAFLLFPYLLDHVGEPLFILFRAIKSQLEKGPVDVVSGEAKNSLSEEKLLRQHMEVKPIDGVVQHEEEEVPIKLWDCDSITQAKEKILDALYRNTPVSKRPQLTGVDLELVSKGDNGVTLRDQDATNSKDGEWVKINTLGHYKLDEMSKNHTDDPRLPIPRFRVVDRERPNSQMGPGNYDTLGTIIANISAANRRSMAMSASELSHVYHLVKPEPEDGDGGGQKIMSEVYLTRLLSTKRILQPYMDKLFEAIFQVPHGKTLPKAIKCLFDFLDLQASELGIMDSDVLHSWKTNSVPLRFWVNLIKNPDFVFDINKSATVDSCLTVIAQAYIDATSTADIRYTKDTPSARLLYVNEVKKYKTEVENYYSVIQALPKLSPSDMAEYLRDTAQVCANSVKQYDPTVAVNDPASMTRQLYFVTESALYELFKFAGEYSEDIIDALNEEGLTITAAQFDKVRKGLSS